MPPKAQENRSLWCAPLTHLVNQWVNAATALLCTKTVQNSQNLEWMCLVSPSKTVRHVLSTPEVPRSMDVNLVTNARKVSSRPKPSPTAPAIPWSFVLNAPNRDQVKNQLDSQRSSETTASIPMNLYRRANHSTVEKTTNLLRNICTIQSVSAATCRTFQAKNLPLSKRRDRTEIV